MKRIYALLLAVGFAAAILALPAEGAGSKPQPAYAAPAAGRLLVELRTIQSGLARERAQLAVLRRALGAGQQGSELQAAMRHTETLLSRATKQSLNLQKTVSTPLAIAVEQVRREVRWAEGNVKAPLAQLDAEAAMDYVVGHVSTGAYGYFELVGARLPRTPNEILGTQAGICGQASMAFAAIVKRLGFQVRAVLFYYTDPWGQADGHTAVEVSYGGSWHFFDPTYGQFWTDASGNVLSIAQVRSGLGTKQRDAASFTNLIEDVSLGDDTWFETDPSTQVVTETWSLNG